MINNISISPKVFKCIHFKSRENLNFTQEQDIFVKNDTQTQEIKRIEKQEYLNKLFNEVYSEVINDFYESNPEYKGINFTKPTIEIIKEPPYEGFEGSYDPTNNRIIISNEFLNIEEMLFQKENGQTTFNYNVTGKTKGEKNQLIKNNNIKEYEICKLTQKEKDFLIKNFFAHETRHFVQQHLIASTEGARDLHKIQMTNAYNAAEDKKQTGNYFINYKPKQILSSNALLKFSTNKNDNRYWNINKEIFEASLICTFRDRNSNSNKYYFGRPTEIDAYNYQYEYILKHENDNCIRKEIIENAKHDALGSLNDGLKYYSEISKELFGNN